MRKLTTPRHTLIEKTAGELAATFYEAGRSQGMTSKYKNARAYAKAYLEMYIPKAVEILIEMLAAPHISDEMKHEIYEALLERANDPDLAILSEKPKQDLSPDIKQRIANSFGIKAYEHGKESWH